MNQERASKSIEMKSMKKEDTNEHSHEHIHHVITTTKTPGTSDQQQYLEIQLKLTLKKLANAKELCAAQEKAVKDAKSREQKAYNQCQTYKYNYEKAQEKLDVI